MGKLISLSYRHAVEASSDVATDDDRLMRQVQEGEVQCFDVLVRRHQSRALAVAYRYLQDSVWAEDVVQCSFVDLYRNRNKYRCGGTFRAYFTRLVINRCKMALRHARCESQMRQSLASQTPRSVADGEDRMAWQRQRLADALSKLSPKLRDVMVLRLSGEMSYKEIADTLNIRIGTVKSRLYAGVETLCRIVEEMPS